MNKVEVNIITEGQTEQTFVRDVLAPYMAGKRIYLYPALIGKQGQKGGGVCFSRAESDIGIFLKQRKDTYVSTMFDYFRIDPKWPGKDQISIKARTGMDLGTTDKAKLLEDETHRIITESFPECNASNRFIPYIEMHEFEALLFSDVSILAAKIGIREINLRKILREFSCPEDINDNPDGAPSKRLEALKIGYRKSVMGPVILNTIGIPKIREKCPHFDEWLKKLENLTGGANGET